MNDESMIYQDLRRYNVPAEFRGRCKLFVQFWWLIHSTFFKYSPQVLYGFRAWLLRLFGARVGVDTAIRSTVDITYPWKLTIGDRVQIGDDVVLYSLGDIRIGDDAVVSQRSYLCAGDHDYRSIDFRIRAHNVVVEDQVWVGADVFVGPGVTIERGAVIGARSSVFRSMPSGFVCFGSPCVAVKNRMIIS